MKKTFLLLAVALAGSVACSSKPAEQQALIDAAEAMGGVQRVLDVKTLTMEGEGDAPNVGQNTMPDGERVFFISTPSAGLWATRQRLEAQDIGPMGVR